jgi:hypothetical protein
MFTENDIKVISQRGISKETVIKQIEYLKKGFPKLNIIKPAIVRDGIKQLSDKKIESCIKIYDKAQNIKKVKFVPASGAATRMFKKFYEVIKNYKGTEDDYLNIMSDRSFDSIYYTCNNIKKFAFYNDLATVVEKKGISFDSISKKKDFPFLLKTLLDKSGLNYGNLPKGLLKFHRTFDGERTPVYEHLIEGIFYAKTVDTVYIHFTVSPAHKKLFRKHIKSIVPKLEKEHKVKFEIEFSIQDEATDTVTVNMKNNIVRDEEGDIVFRPGGHGALIHNLNGIDADLIFIKNIDNIVQDRLKIETYKYKKALAGLLLEKRGKAETFYLKIKENKKDTKTFEDVETFVKKELCVVFPENYNSLSADKKVEFLLNKINRPIRVCGMVKNEGEPGGGPFWIKNSDGSITLQIVESSQFTDDQKKIMEKATHFNPVDIVCSTKNFEGKKYDLLKFIDNNAGFISNKNINGKKIKALELPGLWNGAMADWNTIFVEVPVETFNPVKTINDLLRAEHLFEKDLIAGDNEDAHIID